MYMVSCRLSGLNSWCSQRGEWAEETSTIASTGMSESDLQLVEYKAVKARIDLGAKELTLCSSQTSDGVNFQELDDVTIATALLATSVQSLRLVIVDIGSDGGYRASGALCAPGRVAKCKLVLLRSKQAGTGKLRSIRCALHCAVDARMSSVNIAEY